MLNKERHRERQTPGLQATMVQNAGAVETPWSECLWFANRACLRSIHREFRAYAIILEHLA